MSVAANILWVFWMVFSGYMGWHIGRALSTHNWRKVLTLVVMAATMTVVYIDATRVL